VCLFLKTDHSTLAEGEIIMIGRVLAITSDNDPHVQMVQDHLDSRIIVFDPSISPRGQVLTYKWNGVKFDVLLNEKEIGDVGCVWFRKPKYPHAVSVPDEYLGLTRRSLEAHVRLFYAILEDCKWVSNPWSIWRAGNKLLQMERAFKVGFKVPETVVTTSSVQAEKFRKEVGDVVIKSVSQEALTVSGKTHLFYTRFIPQSQNLDMSGLFVSPTIFQRAINKVCDIRVTVVGNKVFACRITQKESLRDEIDWRKGIGTDNLNYENMGLDSELSTSCRCLVKDLGLKFGTIDLVVGNGGETWFLEINPNGQWGFVERNAGIPISKALASLFMES
jgi:hypothetical protein